MESIDNITSARLKLIPLVAVPIESGQIDLVTKQTKLRLPREVGHSGGVGSRGGGRRSSDSQAREVEKKTLAFVLAVARFKRKWRMK